MSNELDKGDVVQLKIMLQTNIPSSDPKRPATLFTKSMLHQPGKTMHLTNDYPNFTDKKKYPDEWRKLPYEEVCAIFFNVKTFTEELDDVEKEHDPHEIDEIIQKNIMLTLELLFPTKFPAINNVHNSYQMMTGEEPLKTLFFNPFNSHPYSYLKIGSETYTVEKVVWLNDFMNHPRYNEYYYKYIDTDTPGDLRIISSNADITKLIQNKKITQDNLKKIMQCYESSCPPDLPMSTLNVGVNFNAESLKDRKTAEIYVMIDLVEGEINNNIKDFFCSFVGDKLGIKLEELLAKPDKKTKKQLFKHKVDKNRYLYSIKKKNTRTLTETIIEGEKTEQKDDKISPIIRRWFTEHIADDFFKNNVTISPDIYNMQDVKEILNEIYNLKITDSTLIDIIKDNNTQLYEIIDKLSNEKSVSKVSIDHFKKLNIQILTNPKTNDKLKELSKIYALVIDLLLKYNARSHGGKRSRLKRRTRKHKYFR
jgi:hypothetical protein